MCVRACICVCVLQMTEGFWQNEVTPFYQVNLYVGGQEEKFVFLRVYLSACVFAWCSCLLVMSYLHSQSVFMIIIWDRTEQELKCEKRLFQVSSSSSAGGFSRILRLRF